MKKKKHLLNEEFFNKWSPEMAYVLGFWFADGYMRHERSYRILFVSKDYRLLSDIKKCLQSSHPIYHRKDGSGYNFVVYSKQMYLKLLALGGRRCKSKTIKFPKIPKAYLPDFIRGYFDGDGSAFYATYIHTKSKKLRRELRSNFTSGNPEFLEDLQDILIKTLGFVRKKLGSYNNGASQKLGYGTKNTLELLQFMYYPSYPIGLARKALFVKKMK